MRILFKAIAWTAVTLGAASASTFDTKEKQKATPTPEIKITLPKSIASMPPIYLAQLKTDETLPPKKAEEKYKLIKNEHIAMAMKDLDSILFSVIVSHPEFEITKDLETLARNNKEKAWAGLIALELSAERVRPEDEEAVKNNSELPFYKGIKYNLPFLLTQKDSTKESIQKAKEERVRILKEVWERRPTDTDFFFAEDNPNSLFAGILAASKKNYVLNVPFVRTFPGTLYGKNTLLHKDAPKEIFEKTIIWAIKNADLPEAGIVISRLTEEQMTKEIIELARGKLRDTEFGRGAASSKYFPVINDDIDYMFYNPEKKFSEGVASVIEVTDSIKTFSLKNKEFSESKTAGYLAENPSFWENGSHIAEVETFAIKNHKLPISRSIVQHSRFVASNPAKEALRAIAQKDPEAEILYLATKNPNYSRGTERKELEFALKTPGKYTEGLIQGLPHDFLEELTQEALKNPHRSDLATFVQRSDFYPSKEFLHSAKDSPTIMRALSRNPHVGAFTKAN